MLIALDLKTTWLNPNEDKIIKITLVKFDSKTFEIIDSFSTLVNPEIPIDKIISDTISISDSDVLMSPYIDELKYKILDFIWDLPLLWHNISIQVPFLINCSIDISKNILIDTFVLWNFISFNERSLNLEILANSYNIETKIIDKWLYDAFIVIKLFELYIDLINKFNKTKKEIFKYILSRTEDKGLVFIIDNFIDQKIVLIDRSIFIKYILKTFKKLKNKHDLFINKDLKSYSSKDILSKIDGIETRENQKIMLDIIDKCLDNNELHLIEAPTWIWKTFAYLIPSIIYSIKNWEQIFVSTTTKALQDQIYYKDLEFLNNNLWFEFSYSKLKWKRNYFWINSFFNFIEQIDIFNSKQTSFILKIVFWLLGTKSYELDEIEYYGEEFSFLNNINADSKLTFSKKNIYENREPAMIARKCAKKSNIVIINNSILFQDIAWDNSILWNIKNLILDEAHNLEDVVTNSLKKSFSLKDMEKTFAIISNIFKKYKYDSESLLKNYEKLLFDLQVVFDTLELYLDSKIKESSNYKNVLIMEDFYSNNIDSFDLKTLALSIKSKFWVIIDALNIVPDDLYLDISGEIIFLENIVDILDKVLDKDSGEVYIRTINYSNYRWLFLEYSHLNVWNFLYKNLWSKLNSCVLTSATLDAGNNFDYISNILSLDKFKFNTLSSDFDYKKQSLLYIPNDLWSVKNNLNETIEFLKEFTLIVKWRTLVLFTAMYLIKQIYSNIKIELKNNNIDLLAQGISWWSNKILDLYKENWNSSVLLWTDTFWEGIDIPGNNLKYLIIHKIPFMVPTDPVFKARSILFNDSFKEYSIPKSIIKLKQGFWRLIRTKTDSGIVIFLDSRAINTTWWKAILKAFPEEINRKIWSSNKLFSVLQNWTKKQNGKM